MEIAWGGSILCNNKTNGKLYKYIVEIKMDTNNYNWSEEYEYVLQWDGNGKWHFIIIKRSSIYTFYGWYWWNGGKDILSGHSHIYIYLILTIQLRTKWIDFMCYVLMESIVKINGIVVIG